MTTWAALANALMWALRALPIGLAWRINREIESLTHQILKHEALNTVADRRHADELRLKLAYRRRLHDALLPALHRPESGHPG